MNILPIETFNEPIPTVSPSQPFKKDPKLEYTSERDIELEIKTTTALKNIGVSAREELIRLLKNKNVMVKDEQLFYGLLKKLYQDEIKLITDIVRKLLNENHSFHIEVYETDGDLEDLYFVIHYGENVLDENVEEDIFRLNEYVREIDKDKALWFVGFASEIKNV